MQMVIDLVITESVDLATRLDLALPEHLPG